jgi:hypothetical protein
MRRWRGATDQRRGGEAEPPDGARRKKVDLPCGQLNTRRVVP